MPEDPAIHVEGLSIWCPKCDWLLAVGQHGRVLSKKDWAKLPEVVVCTNCDTVYDVPEIEEWGP